MLVENLIGQDLHGWQLKYGYIMEIDQGPMGSLPVIVAESGWPVVCLDKEHLRLIYERLPKRRVRIRKAVFLFIEGTAVPFGHLAGYDPSATHFFCVSREYLLKKYVEKEGFFRWTREDSLPIEENGAVFPEMSEKG